MVREGFDTLAAETVLELKKDYSQIKLLLLLPCFEQTRGWEGNGIYIYNEIKVRSNKVVYTSDYYFYGCVHVRNRYLVDNSQYCIYYLIREAEWRLLPSIILKGKLK